jgi:hypothetical protein
MVTFNGAALHRADRTDLLADSLGRLLSPPLYFAPRPIGDLIDEYWGPTVVAGEPRNQSDPLRAARCNAVLTMPTSASTPTAGRH